MISSIKNHLAFGNGIEDFSVKDNSQDFQFNVSKEIQSRRGRQIFCINDKTTKQTKNDTRNVIVALCIFFDDFDPSVSISRSNRNEIFVLMVSIVSENAYNLEFGSTYIISLGQKGADHGPVFQRFLNEIKYLQDTGISLTYLGILGKEKMVSVKASIF